MNKKRNICAPFLALSFVLLAFPALAQNKNYSFTEGDVAQIYNLAFSEIVKESQKEVVISSDFGEYENHLTDIFRDKELKTIRRYFQVSPTNSWPPKKKYFDLVGKIILVSGDEINNLVSDKVKVFKGTADNSATYEHSQKKEIIQFSRIAFNDHFNEAYLFVSYYNNPLDSEICFCYLQKTNDKWTVKLIFTVSIS